MSTGESPPLGIGFGKRPKSTHAKASRRMAIARWAQAQRTIGDVEVTAETVSRAQIKALWDVCMNGSPLAEDCAVALGRLVLDEGDADDNVAMALDRIVDVINARVRSRAKEF